MWTLPHPLSLQDLSDLYSLYSGDSEKVELFVGGMLLSTYQGRMTQVFRLILVDQVSKYNLVQYYDIDLNRLMVY